MSERNPLIADNIYLSDELRNRLNSSWQAFVTKKATEMTPNLIVDESRRTSIPQNTDRSSLLLLEDMSDEISIPLYVSRLELMSTIIFTAMMSLMQIYIVSTFVQLTMFFSPFLILTIGTTLMNPLYWRTWKRAVKHKAVYFGYIYHSVLLCLIGKFFLEYIFSPYVVLSSPTTLLTIISIGLLVPVTPIPQLFTSVLEARRLQKRERKIEEIKQRQKLIYNNQIEKRREQIYEDPTIISDFLNNGTEDIWSSIQHPWNSRIQEISQLIAQGEILERIIREDDAPSEECEKKCKLIRDGIDELNAERNELIAQIDKLTLSRKALEELAQRLENGTRKQKTELDLANWVSRQRTGSEEARLMLERTELELRSLVSWFRNQLLDVHAHSRAKDELASLDRRLTVIPPDSAQQEAEFEIARMEQK